MVEQQKTNVSEGAVRKIPYDVIPTLENELQDRGVFWFYFHSEAMRWIDEV